MGRTPNLQLSGERALAIKALLVAKGVKKERLLAVGFGQNKPIADNATPEVRPRIAAPSSASQSSTARSTWASIRRAAARSSSSHFREAFAGTPALEGSPCAAGSRS